MLLLFQHIAIVNLIKKPSHQRCSGINIVKQKIKVTEYSFYNRGPHDIFVGPSESGKYGSWYLSCYLLSPYIYSLFLLFFFLQIVFLFYLQLRGFDELWFVSRRWPNLTQCEKLLWLDSFNTQGTRRILSPFQN